MNNLLAVIGLMLFADSASADPVIANDVVNTIPSMQQEYGVSNVRMVMPGVLYRGGSTVVGRGQSGRIPLQPGSLDALCNDGFDAVVYGYSKGWKGPPVIQKECRPQ